VKRVVILTTGGTIAMRVDEGAGGAVPALDGADFVRALPAGIADVRVRSHGRVPTSHFTIEHLWSIAQAVRELAASAETDGVVVTHGTDTLEETAYLLDLVCETDKPVVVTGAMRTASEPGYEGFANVEASVRTATADGARGLGTLVVMNGEIHAGRDVTKSHTTAIETFVSPEWGPIGRVDADRVLIARRVSRELAPAIGLESEVHLLKLAVGMDARLLAVLAADQRTRGIVIEALGGGRVPPWWMPVIRTCLERGIVVVIASRTGRGRTIDGYAYDGAHRDLAAAGCLFAGGLTGVKARIKLMVVLGAGSAAGDAANWFERNKGA
jgi:L-asparaginase